MNNSQWENKGDYAYGGYNAFVRIPILLLRLFKGLFKGNYHDLRLFKGIRIVFKRPLFREYREIMEEKGDNP